MRKEKVEFPDEREISHNSHLTTIRRLGRSYTVMFQVKYTSVHKEWSNILLLTSTDNTCCESGDRIPGVWLWKERHTSSGPKLRVCTSIKEAEKNENGNYCLDSPEPVPSDVWTDVRISQRLEGSSLRDQYRAWYRYEVAVNGVVIASVLNKGAREYADVKVYASDPWPNNLNGSIRQLLIVPEMVPGMSKQCFFFVAFLRYFSIFFRPE